MPDRQHVLVVDDNAISQEIFHEILDETYWVITANSVDEAFLFAKQFTPALILLDGMFSGIEGYELCRALRRVPMLKGTRILIVSSKAMPADLIAGIQAGADAYLTKPFDDIQLLALMHDSYSTVPRC